MANVCTICRRDDAISIEKSRKRSSTLYSSGFLNESLPQQISLSQPQEKRKKKETQKEYRVPKSALLGEIELPPRKSSLPPVPPSCDPILHLPEEEETISLGDYCQQYVPFYQLDIIDSSLESHYQDWSSEQLKLSFSNDEPLPLLPLSEENFENQEIEIPNFFIM